MNLSRVMAVIRTGSRLEFLSEKGRSMNLVNLLSSAGLVSVTMLSLAGCATRQAFTDASIEAERRNLARCAVLNAFSSTDQDKPEAEVARVAMGRCETEREAVGAKLIRENAGRPNAGAFVAGYLDELTRTMQDHIAVRLAEARARKRGPERNGPPPKGSWSI